MDCEACCTSLRPPILPYRQALAKKTLGSGRMACDFLSCAFDVSWDFEIAQTGGIDKELYVRASDLVRVSSKAASRTATRLFNINHPIGTMKARSWGNQPYRSLSKRKLSVSVMSFDTVNPGTRTTISGYWVGPDTEDGWGYVEAVVDRSV
ncbi:hypothetical protein MUK42_06797 [Musa troglodytarum]|uniref:Uncharacterized protein n=1 Tax=Musa troglodytarum TaxID=320322 RepID=A0A9E7HRZ4_9LILI|nr:hypothetical protein MUK42_06797 [Musa troglodytarum]